MPRIVALAFSLRLQPVHRAIRPHHSIIGCGNPRRRHSSSPSRISAPRPRPPGEPPPARLPSRAGTAPAQARSSCTSPRPVNGALLYIPHPQSHTIGIRAQSAASRPDPRSASLAVARSSASCRSALARINLCSNSCVLSKARSRDNRRIPQPRPSVIPTKTASRHSSVAFPIEKPELRLGQNGIHQEDFRQRRRTHRPTFPGTATQYHRREGQKQRKRLGTALSVSHPGPQARREHPSRARTGQGRRSTMRMREVWMASSEFALEGINRDLRPIGKSFCL